MVHNVLRVRVDMREATREELLEIIDMLKEEQLEDRASYEAEIARLKKEIESDE